MIFQDPMSSLNPRHRVRQIVGAPLRLHGVADVPARVAEALDHVGCRKPWRRVSARAFGWAAAKGGHCAGHRAAPRFYLADEIVSGLDVSSQAQVLNCWSGWWPTLA